ncbi:phenylacetate--CoA ligase family protein [Chitinophaga pendula]|uniref:phenylacetate--CoA ligase family protein n=1 Tax=Chitinophaga TaxID=79328 RepID=UPI000BAF86D2|nr:MULTISPECIES: phenylacetate--CoA ligase family protein [Chitinophaga]ASZ09596.1 adenylate-forming protein [Chitinophaga sp. MD30]UCJ07470.1 phenylacetate--CoA ligase family protein [Chitinophaga pendula]
MLNTKPQSHPEFKTLSIFQLLKIFWQGRKLRPHEKWNREQIKQHQEKELRKLRDFAYSNSPFYKKFHKGLENSPLHELPVLTKKELMSSWDEIVTDRSLHLKDVENFLNNLKGAELYRDKYYAYATGGTTGVKGIFIYSKKEWFKFFSIAIRSSGWINIPFHFGKKSRMAIVQSTLPWHVAGGIAFIKIPFVNMLALDTTEPLEQIVKKLNDFQPNLLGGFAENIHTLAKEQLAGRLRIKPDTITSTAETLKKEARKAIEEAWGIKPFEEYGATETGVIASECEAHNGQHIYEDLVVVEVVDNDNKIVPPGEYGNKILVTVLWNRTLPIIRYELSDHIKLDTKPCSCGRIFTLIKEIQGREENVIHLPGQAGNRVAIEPDLFFDNMVLLPIDGWQIVQEKEDTISFLILGPHKDFKEADFLKHIVDEIVKHGAKPPSVKVEYIKELKKTKLGKTITIQALKKGEK